MSTLRRILSVAGIMAASTALAFGSQITQTFTLPTGSNSTNWTESGSVNQFNTSLGTLNFISITISGSATASGSAVDSGGSNATDYEFDSDTTFKLTDPDLKVAVVGLASFVQAFPGRVNGDIMTVTNAPSSDSETNVYNGSNGNRISTTGGGTSATSINLASYEGLGLITWSLNAKQVAGFTGGPFTGGTASGTANATVTVVYDYSIPSTTPEPTTMVLFGSALLGLGLIRRRVAKN